MFKCIQCKTKTKVLNTIEDMRRRVCPNCHQVFWTEERLLRREEAVANVKANNDKPRPLNAKTDPEYAEHAAARARIDPTGKYRPPLDYEVYLARKAKPEVYLWPELMTPEGGS